MFISRYKNRDPRASIMKKMCHEVLSTLSSKDEDPLLAVALALEKAAENDDYFKDRKLYANVDFYSGIVFRALGIPESMFTVIFATARAVGWISHWLELMKVRK